MKHLSMISACLLLTGSAVAQTPPTTWQEHWFEHVQLLNRVFYDNDVAVYYDNDVSTSVTWLYTFAGDVWRYTKSVYGSFGSDGHLFAVFHTNKYSGGHPSTYFDASHDYRNVIDVGPGPWTSGSGNDLDIVTHEVAHIVEGASKGYHNSPAFGIWGDSKWAEIFIYDVYKGLGRSSDATRWYNLMINGSDNFPRANTHWFKDWFYPIYRDYGGTQALNKYFTLLAQYFPKSGTNYSRSMNMGEFIHFWSGAAGVNLKEVATTAFGWTTTYESQFNQARIDFPFTYPNGVVTVYKDCNYTGSYAVSLLTGSYTLSQLQAKGISNDDISSLKVVSGYKATLYWDDNYLGSTLLKTADDACLVDDGWNDKASSLVIAPVSPNTRIVTTPVTATRAIPLEAAAAKGFEISPNPVTNMLNIASGDNLSGGQLHIYDIVGRQVLVVRPVTNKVDVSKLSTGIYTLVFTKEGKTITKRFVK